MQRRTAYTLIAATAALVIGGMSLWPPDADARPLPAHHPQATLNQEQCIPSGAWSALLTVGADVAGGTAHIQPEGVTGFDMKVPGTYKFQAISNSKATFTVTVTVSWPDDFVAAPITLTAHRPADGCVVPTTSSTTCEQANPPRDCTEVTTSPPTTAPTATSTAPPTTLPSSTSAPTGVTTPPTVRPTPTTPSTLFLPTTGPSDALPFTVVGVGAVVAGVLLLAVRRRAA